MSEPHLAARRRMVLLNVPSALSWMALAPHCYTQVCQNLSGPWLANTGASHETHREAPTELARGTFALTMSSQANVFRSGPLLTSSRRQLLVTSRSSRRAQSRACSWAGASSRGANGVRNTCVPHWTRSRVPSKADVWMSKLCANSTMRVTSFSRRKPCMTCVE